MIFFFEKLIWIGIYSPTTKLASFTLEEDSKPIFPEINEENIFFLGSDCGRNEFPRKMKGQNLDEMSY